MKKSVMLLLLICSQLSAMEESIASKQGTEGWTKQEWRSYRKLMNTQLYEVRNEVRNKRRRIKKEKPVPLTPYSSPYVTDSDD